MDNGSFILENYVGNPNSVKFGLSFLPPVPVSSANFSITGCHVAHDGEDDEGHLVEGAPADANFWRRFDYQITRDPTSDDANETALWTLAPENRSEYLKDYSIGERSSGGFFYKLYAWPINILDADGEPLCPTDKRSFPVSSLTNLTQNLTVDADPGAVALTLYCTAGPSATIRDKRLPIRLSFGDLYGNAAGVMVLDPSVIPTKYNRNTLENLNFIGVPGASLKPCDSSLGGMFTLQSPAKPGHGAYVKNLGTFYEPCWVVAYGALKDVKDSVNTHHWFNADLPETCKISSCRDFAEGWGVGDEGGVTGDGSTATWTFEPVWSLGSFAIRNQVGGYLTAPTNFESANQISANASGDERDYIEWQLQSVDNADTRSGRRKWAKIADPIWTIAGNSSTNGRGTVYANGRHSIRGRLQFTLEDESDNAVTGDDCPSIGYVVQALKFLNYDDGSNIGEGDNLDWKVKYSPNVFVDGSVAQSFAQKDSDGHVPGQINKDTGKVFIDFYVRCTKIRKQNINFGFQIRIHEPDLQWVGIVVDDSVSLQETDSIQKFSVAKLTFTAQSPILLTEDMLLSTGQLIANPPDHVPADPNLYPGVNYRDQLWKHWIYQIKLQGQVGYVPELRQAVINAPNKDWWFF
ncbi:hypothetical protein HED55_09985 [Ochrobactrum haematophilum]|uniref:Uncharacterized protein n=1 Tax=Brucella haematophila TaxID=419474 RepID=A0ABX1DKM7_9HYPH|nr:hypothetical protein [Brucella haematophila]